MGILWCVLNTRIFFFIRRSYTYKTVVKLLLHVVTPSGVLPGRGWTADTWRAALPCSRDVLIPHLRTHRCTLLRKVHKWSCGEK